MAGELDRSTIEKAYARWAPVYDLVFGAVFERGRKAAIAAAERACGRRAHPRSRRRHRHLAAGLCALATASSAIDISEPMLRKAQERVVEHSASTMSRRWR